MPHVDAKFAAQQGPPSLTTHPTKIWGRDGGCQCAKLSVHGVEWNKGRSTGKTSDVKCDVKYDVVKSGDMSEVRMRVRVAHTVIGAL